MRTRTRPGRPARLWLLACLLTFGCSGATPIAEILEDPRGYEGKVVTVQGEVTGSVNLAIVKGFTVRDTTGEIIVVTERAVPRLGDTMSVKGRVQQLLAVEETSLVVLVEEATE